MERAEKMTIGKTAALLIPLFAVSSGAMSAQWIHQSDAGIPRLPDGKPNLNAAAPRLADGKPDLSGVWNRISPKYRVNIAADLKDEDVQPSARKLVATRIENLGRESMNARCLPSGPAYATDADSTAGGMMKIIQTPAMVLILNPDLTYRQIFLDGRKLEPAPNPAWMGYSVGRWEGDTLVVESNGYNDQSWLDSSGHPHSEALRMTERYRRKNFGALELDVTYADPSLYAHPWTVSVRAELAADTDLIEYVCNEERTDLGHWVGKASDAAKSETKILPEILAKYAGTYVEQPPLWRIVPRTVVVTFESGALYGNLDGRGKERQYASSETTFSGFSGLGLEFVRDGQGAVTGLLIKHVSGDYRFDRRK